MKAPDAETGGSWSLVTITLLSVSSHGAAGGICESLAEWSEVRGRARGTLTSSSWTW